MVERLDESMKQKMSKFVLLTLSIFVLSSCRQQKVKTLLSEYETKFAITLPKEYDVLFYISSSGIDSYTNYIVLKVNEAYTLSYDEQFTTDYADYKNFDVFNKILLAKDHFTNLMKQNDEKYFVTSLTSYDWYASEYTRVTGQYNVVRYVDLYVIHDQAANDLYLFYDQHQYPYNDQIGR